MLEQLYYDKADEIIQHYGRKPASLIPIMQDIQEEFRYLPGELLTYVAAEIGITKQKHIVLQHFMKIFLLMQKENMSSKFAMEQPVM